MEPFNGDHFLHAEVARLIGKWDVSVAIETGTYQGATTSALAHLCNEVLSIESNEQNCHAAIEHWQDKQSNITFLHGSSPEVLKNINDFHWRKRILFYLDAHWGEYWPLLDELAVIADRIKDCLPVIVIHDFKHPNEPRPGYDSYNGQDLDWAYVQSHIEKIYPSGFTRSFNDKAIAGANQGAVFIEPGTT